MLQASAPTLVVTLVSSPRRLCVTSTSAGVLLTSKYYGQRVLVNQLEPGIGGQNLGQWQVRSQHHHARLIQVRIGRVSGLGALRCVEELVELVAVEVVAAINGHGVVGHVPH